MLLKNSIIFFITVFAIGIAFLVPQCWPLAFVGLGFFMAKILTLQSHKAAILYAYISGIGVTLFPLSPIFLTILPLDWFGIQNEILQIALAAGSLLLAAMILGLHFSFFGITARFLHTGTWRDVLIFPSLWILSEWLSAWLFYIILLGPGSYFGTHFTLHWLGYLLADDYVLLQSAWLGGIYTLSFIVVFLGTLIFKCLHTSKFQKKQKYYFILISFFVCWFPLSILLPKQNVIHTNEASPLRDPVQIGVISRYQPPLLTQTDIQEKEIFEKTHSLIQSITNIEVLVFPENTTFLRIAHRDDRRDVFTHLRTIGKNGESPLIIDSEDIQTQENIRHSQVIYAQENAEIQFGYKQQLLPLGEYLPYIYLLPLQMFESDTSLNLIQNVRKYQPKKITGQGKINGATVAARFCNEVLSPELYRKTTLDGAEILINISSLSWFHGSPLVYEQMKRIAKVRAVENRRWYIQSGNMAPAFALNEYGVTVAETTWGKAGTLEISATPYTKKTPYTVVGAWILLLPLLCIFLFHKKTRRS